MRKKCYGAERWAMRSEDENRIETTEMRMSKMIRGNMLKDKVRNMLRHDNRGNYCDNNTIVMTVATLLSKYLDQGCSFLQRCLMVGVMPYKATRRK